MNHRTRSRRSSIEYASGFPRLPKLSGIILDYATPLTDAVDEIPDTNTAISMAILCWNLSLLPMGAAQEKLRMALQEMANGDETLESELTGMFASMQARKKALYPHDRRLIVEHSVTETDGQLHLFVASTPMPEPV